MRLVFYRVPGELWRTRFVIEAVGDVPAERFWQAGLDASDSRCFVSSCDEDIYVFDLETKTLLSSFDDEGEHSEETRPIEDMLRGLDLPLAVGEEEVLFRIFGLHYGNGPTQVGSTAIRVDEAAAKVVFSGGGGEQRLPYDAFSGDWAYCSLALTGRVAALIEPYEVRIFERGTPFAR